MRKKLTFGALVVTLLTVLVLGGNQVIIQLFSRFTEKLILENNELYALEELKGSLGKILIYENHYLVSRESFASTLEEAEEKMALCRAALSMQHKGEVWSRAEKMFLDLQENILLLESSEKTDAVVLHVISHQVLDLIGLVESLVNETALEVREYEEKSRKARIHGTATVIVLGILLILVMSIGAYLFIRSLTRPIEHLVETTKKIGEGQRDLRVQVPSTGEFSQLALSINQMLDVLNQTSLSEKHLSNILNHLYGALLVSDHQGLIRSVNQSTTRLLDFAEDELLGKKILSVFGSRESCSDPEDTESADLEALAAHLRKEAVMTSKVGKEIPVYVTAVILKDHKDQAEGMVVVGHDLTEEKAQEARMEKMRKDRVIAIHEAQELERLRVSRDLHDGLGQILTGMAYSLQQHESGEGLGSDMAERLSKQIQMAIQESKNIAQNLTPVVLKDFGLPAAIENLVHRSNLLGQTRFTFNSYSFESRIDERLEKALFRICQEAVHNILKHAKASEASIELYRAEDMIVLVVEDNGKGFNPQMEGTPKVGSGVGLISIQERIEAYDGELSIDSSPGKGSEMMIEVPCRKTMNHE